MTCEKFYLGICFVTPSSPVNPSFFGFGEFITALALLIIVYTLTDIRYRFRISITPISLFPLTLFSLTFFLIGFIGFGTLLTDIWFSEGWFVPESLLTQSMWRGILGSLFLSLVMTWMYYAFIKPPIFSEKNYKRFFDELYKIIVKGSDSELPVIANELAKSAESLIKLSRYIPARHQKKQDGNKGKHIPNASDYAYEILLLIGNRKLCRHIIESTPITAIVFFDEMTVQEKYHIPIGQFSKNISSEAILNKDSPLYHEDEGYKSGLIGYLKPFSQAIYGNHQLVESLHSHLGSPLDIHHETVWTWDASQLEVYSRLALITLESYLKSGNLLYHSYGFSDALRNIKSSCRDVYKLEDIDSDYYSTDIYKRLQVTVNFVKKAIELLDKQKKLPSTRLKLKDKLRDKNIYDHLADLMFKIIFYASSVKEPRDECWDIQYVTVWSEFVDHFSEGTSYKIINFKLRRLLYDEIRQMEEIPNYKSAKILGFCLNVMGLKIKKKIDRKCTFPLKKTILAWTSKNYLRLRSIQPEVAKSCLIGSISFDEETNRLVKTYNKGLSLEAPKEHLELKSIKEENLHVK